MRRCAEVTKNAADHGEWSEQKPKEVLLQLFKEHSPKNTFMAEVYKQWQDAAFPDFCLLFNSKYGCCLPAVVSDFLDSMMRHLASMVPYNLQDDDDALERACRAQGVAL